MVEAISRKCITLAYDVSNVDEAIKGATDAAACLDGLDIVINNASRLLTITACRELPPTSPAHS
jgi:NAD(P)-dependent dehydrogenase (short-subunit alcohol dehydrogenase family)